MPDRRLQKSQGGPRHLRSIDELLTGPTLYRGRHASGGVLFLDEAERMRDNKAADVAELRSMLLAGYRLGGQTHLADDNGASSLRCHICDSANLVEDQAGLRCGDCWHLLWIDTGDGLMSVTWHDHDQGGLAPDDLPQCGSCERFCDTKTIDGAWHCSPCVTTTANSPQVANQHYVMPMQASFDRAVAQGASLPGGARGVTSKVPLKVPPTVQDNPPLNPDTKKADCEIPVNVWVYLASALGNLPLDAPARA